MRKAAWTAALLAALVCLGYTVVHNQITRSVLVGKQGYADPWEDSAASELDSYSHILSGGQEKAKSASFAEKDKKKAWSSEAVQAELRDAAEHDSELSRYQGILKFSDAPTKSHHERALRRGSEPANEILTFPSVKSKGKRGVIHPPRAQTAIQGRAYQQAYTPVKHTAASPPKGKSALVGKTSHNEVQATSPEEAILLRPPPLSLPGANNNPLLKEWVQVYDEAQDLARKQAGLVGSVPPHVANKAKEQELQQEPEAGHSHASNIKVQAKVKSAVLNPQLQQQQQRPEQHESAADLCAQCKHAWSSDALACIRSSCAITRIDEQQLELDNKIASILATYMPPDDHKVVVLSDFVLPADATASRTWIHTRASPGLAGLGLASGRSTSLTMEETHLVSASDCRQPGAPDSAPTLEQALKPLVEEQVRINMARGAASSANRRSIVELSWAPSDGYKPYYGVLHMDAQPHVAAKRQAHVPRAGVSMRMDSGETIGDITRAEEQSESGQLAKELEQSDEALQQTLVHKQELLDALEPQAAAQDDALKRQASRTGDRLAREVSELQALEKRETTREGAIQAQQHAQEQLDVQRSEEKALQEKHDELETRLKMLKEKLQGHDKHAHPLAHSHAHSDGDLVALHKSVHTAEAASVASEGGSVGETTSYAAKGQTDQVRSVGQHKESTGENAGKDSSGDEMLSMKEVDAVVRESGVLEGIASHAASLAKEAAQSHVHKRSEGALMRHRARVMERQLEDLRGKLHTHAVLVEDDARRVDLLQGGKQMRNSVYVVEGDARKLEQTGAQHMHALAQEVRELEEGVSEVAPREVLVGQRAVSSRSDNDAHKPEEAAQNDDETAGDARDGRRRHSALTSGVSDNNAPVAHSLMELSRGEDARDHVLFERMTHDKASSLSATSHRGSMHDSDTLDDDNDAGDVGLTGLKEWSQKRIREEGRYAEQRQLRHAEQRLVDIEKVADKRAYQKLLHRAQVKRLEQVGKFASAEAFADKEVRNSLARADGVFADKSAQESKQDAERDAVRRAIAAAHRVERETKASRVQAHKEREAAQARLKEAESKGYIPGIGFVHKDKQSSILSEIWDSHKVPVVKAIAKEATEQVPLVVSAASAAQHSPSGWSLAAEATGTAENVGSAVGKVVGGALSSMAQDSERRK